MTETVNEEWRDIKGYEGLYIVSNRGRVKRCARYDNNWCGKVPRFLKEKEMQHWLNEKGYCKVALVKDRERHDKFIHRLVAENFIDNPNNLEQVNHIDGDKTNNNVENLEWCTCKQNIRHAYEHNLVDIEKRVNSRKDNHNVIYDGEIMNLSKFSRVTGISRSKAYKLLCKGASIEEIISKHGKAE